ncbi:hypothetical protein U1Q18_009356 [Sarracenia purpurea var. burkii]
MKEQLKYRRIQILTESLETISKSCELKVGNIIYPISCFEDVSEEPNSKFKIIKDRVNITPPTNYLLNTDKEATIAEVSNINQEELVKTKFGPFDNVINISQVDESLLELPNVNTNGHMDKAIENVRIVDKNLGVEDPITNLTAPVVVGFGSIMNVEVSEHVQNQEGFNELMNNNLVQSKVACSAKPAPIPKENQLGKGHIVTKTRTNIFWNLGKNKHPSLPITWLTWAFMNGIDYIVGIHVYDSVGSGFRA